MKVVIIIYNNFFYNFFLLLKIKMLQLAEPDEVQEFMMPILNGLFSGCALRSVNLFKVQFYIEN